MSDRPAADRTRQRPLTRAGVVAVLMLGAMLRLYAVVDDPTPDSLVYAQYAHNLLHGNFTLRDDAWYAHRLPVFAPVTFAYAVAGVNMLTTHAWPLLLSLLQLVSTMWLGFRLMGRTTGLVAGALLAFLPLDADQAGHLMPDGPMATLLTLAAAAWIGGREGPGRHSRLLMFVSGLCLALAVVVRLYAVVLVVLYIGHVSARPRAARDLLWPALGGAAVVVPLAVLYQAAAGDALHPLRVVLGAYGQRLLPEEASLLVYPSLLWHPRQETALYPVLSLAAIVFALARRRRTDVLLLLWALPLFLFLEFGSMSLRAFVPVFKQTRFLTVLAAPLSLLAASMLCAVVPWLRARLRKVRRGRLWRAVAATVGSAMLLVGVADSLYVVRRDRMQPGVEGARARAVARLLAAEPDAPAVVDHWRTALLLSYFSDFERGSDVYVGADDRVRMLRRAASSRARLQYLSWYPDSTQVPPGFVVLDDAVLAAIARADSTGRGPFAVAEIPAYARHPPAAWRLLRRIGTWRIYRVPSPAVG